MSSPPSPYSDMPHTDPSTSASSSSLPLSSEMDITPSSTAGTPVSSIQGSSFQEDLYSSSCIQGSFEDDIHSDTTTPSDATLIDVVPAPPTQPLLCGNCRKEECCFVTSAKENAIQLTEKMSISKPKCCVCNMYFHVHCCDIKDDKIFTFLGRLQPFWKCFDCLNIPSDTDLLVSSRIQYLQSCETYEKKMIFYSDDSPPGPDDDGSVVQ